MLFRAPQQALDQEFIAFFGGTQTFAATTTRPYPDLLAEQMGIACINFASDGGGLEAIIRDDTLRDIGRKARHVVIELTSPAMISNRFYTVDPQRNHVLVRFAAPFRDLCRGIALDQVTTVDMLPALLPQPLRQALEAEIRTAWAARIKQFLHHVDRPTSLLFLGDAEDLSLMGQSALMQLAGEGHTMLQIRPRRGAGGIIDTAGHSEIAHRLAPVLQAAGLVPPPANDQIFAVSSGTAVKRSATKP
ncbi:DUF6473 family protein [Ketogulonicigenium vulgare]|uniref:DUF6473 family protein n=1 Tax=Ketogulonicigenium vulgare TaxID=92945 RepID=UPI0005C68FB9|nr:DUF6473 family protein [Ketogulonicigenium vulgare]ALJ80022.1 hypothetical protein KVH_01770 [Ketogulonicigenium vulgare]